MATACITGASSGIGRSYALRLAGMGYRLIIAGRRREKLEEVRRETEAILRDSNFNPAGKDASKKDASKGASPLVEVFIGDLSQPERCDALLDVLRKRDDCSLLIHNAGFGTEGSFLDSDPATNRSMVEVHVQCAVRLVHGFIPILTEPRSHDYNDPSVSPDPTDPTDLADPTDLTDPTDTTVVHLPKGIILVSSLAAFVPIPDAALYISTKAFLLSFGRAVHPRIVKEGGALQVLCPGFTHTDFHDKIGWSTEARRDRGLVKWMRPDEVVAGSLQRFASRDRWRDPVYVPGRANRILYRLVRLISHRFIAKGAMRRRIE